MIVYCTVWSKIVVWTIHTILIDCCNINHTIKKCISNNVNTQLTLTVGVLKFYFKKHPKSLNLCISWFVDTFLKWHGRSTNKQTLHNMGRQSNARKKCTSVPNKEHLDEPYGGRVKLSLMHDNLLLLLCHVLHENMIIN